MPLETILTIEDDAPIRQFVVAGLTHYGFDVSVAADGALALLSAAAKPPDLVVTDLVLPSMSGTELLARLRVDRPALKALLVSGYTQEAALLRGELPANTAFLSKPFTLAALVAKLDALLKSATP